MLKIFSARLKLSSSYLAAFSPPASPIHEFSHSNAQAAIIASALRLGIARLEHGNIVLVQ